MLCKVLFSLNDSHQFAVLAYVIGIEGVKLGVLDNNGRTAMHAAARNSHAQAVFMLLDAGGISLAEKQDSEGTTAIHFAAIAGEENIIRVLVQVSFSLSFPPSSWSKNNAKLTISLPGIRTHTHRQGAR